MTSTAFRRIVGGLDLLPVLSLKVENEEIVEGDSLVVDTTMASEHVDLAVKKSGSSVSTRSGTS